jgi:hypothetical protein
MIVYLVVTPNSSRFMDPVYTVQNPWQWPDGVIKIALWCAMPIAPSGAMPQPKINRRAARGEVGKCVRLIAGDEPIIGGVKDEF